MLEQRIHKLIEPVVQSLGLELWTCHLNQHGNHALLRIYIDRSDDSGVTVDDCSRVSREIGAILDVEDVIKKRYQLEVSSPGLERSLLTLTHFARYIGSRVKVKLRVIKQDHRQFVGRIEKIMGDNIFFQIENEILAVTINEIQKANIVIG